MVDTIGDFQDDDSDLMDLLQSEGDFPDMSQVADPTLRPQTQTQKCRT